MKVRMRMQEESAVVEVLVSKTWVPFYDFIEVHSTIKYVLVYFDNRFQQKNERVEAVRLQGIQAIPKNFKMSDFENGSQAAGGIAISPFE